jgi:hypothetical protein
LSCDKSLRCMTLLTLNAFFMLRCSAIHACGELGELGN